MAGAGDGTAGAGRSAGDGRSADGGRVDGAGEADDAVPPAGADRDAGGAGAGRSATPGVEAPDARMRELFGAALPGAERFARMLAEQGELRGLIGPRELPRLWTRHLANSAAVVDFLPRRGAVADVGSGAGFPGVVIALLRPDLEVTLIEPMERRIDWLTDVVAELDLANAVVRRARAQEVRDRFDAVTARAVAGLPRLVRITAPRLRPGGRLLAHQGARARDEVDEARRAIKGAGLEPAVIHDVVTPGGESTRVVEIRRRRSG